MALFKQRSEFGQRLFQARKQAGLKQKELADKVGMSQSTYAEAEASGQGSSFTAQLAAACGVRPEWLATGEGFMLPAPADDERPQFMRSSVQAMEPILSWEHESELPPGEFVMIRRLDVHLSAGHGKDQLVIEFTDIQPQAFRADWIRREKLKPKKLASMTADGDSMEDRIHHGDALVVDTSQTDVKDGKVYALWYDGGERVKRLFRLPGGGLRIHSDNEAKYPDIIVKPEELNHIRIIGRVVHTAGTGGL